MKIMTRLGLTLPLLTFFVACSNGNQNEPTTEVPTPQKQQTSAPVEAPIATKELVKKVEMGFKNLYCRTELKTKEEPVGDKGVQFIAIMDCGSGAYWSSSMDLLLQLKKIQENIRTLSDRSDVSQTDKNMTDAIGRAINRPAYELEGYLKKLKKDEKLITELEKQLSCVPDLHTSKYECQPEALEKFTDVYVSLFSNESLQPDTLTLMDRYDLVRNYRPLEKRKLIFESLKKLYEAKYPRTITRKTGSGDSERTTTLTLWMAFDLNVSLVPEGYSPRGLTAKEIRTVMSNIQSLLENGNALADRLHESHDLKWIDIRFTADESIQQIDPDGARFFAKLVEPVSSDSLVAEAKTVAQLANDLKMAFAEVNALYPGEISVWKMSYPLEAIDGSDYIGGILPPSTARLFISKLKEFSQYKKDYENIRDMIQKAGMKMEMSIGIASKRTFPLSVGDNPNNGDNKTARLFITMSVTGSWKYALDDLAEHVQKKPK